MGVGGDVFGRADVRDLGLWEMCQDRLNQRVFFGLDVQDAFRGVADLGDRVRAAFVHNAYGPTVARPGLQALAQTLREIARGGVGGDEFDAAWLIGGETQRGFDFDQQFDIPVRADEFDHMFKGWKPGEGLGRVMGEGGHGAGAARPVGEGLGAGLNR